MADPHDAVDDDQPPPADDPGPADGSPEPGESRSANGSPEPGESPSADDPGPADDPRPADGSPEPGESPSADDRPASRWTGIWALVLGIASVFCCFPAGILAIILGVRGRRQAARGTAANATMATVGLALGIVGLLGTAVAYGYYSGIIS